MLLIDSTTKGRFGGRLAWIGLALFLVVAVVAVHITDNSARDKAEHEVSQRLNVEVAQQAELLDLIIRQLSRDVHYLANTPPFQGMVRATANNGFDAEQNSSLEIWKSRLQVIFSAYLQAHENVFQVRLIGTDNRGLELVRVDMQGGEPRPVPEAELQVKGDRAYFSRALSLRNGAILISDINLNRERGELEVPLRPTVRVSMPIFGLQGEVFGVLVVNFDLSRWLASLRTAKHPIYLLNSEGDFLAHPDQFKTFGFEQGRRFRWAGEFQTESSVASLNSGWFVGPPGRVLATVRQWPERELTGMSGPKLYFLATAPESVVENVVSASRIQVLSLLSLAAGVGAVWVYLIGINIQRREEAGAKNAELAAIINSSNDAIIGKTLEGVVSSWNHSAENMFGYSSEEAIGRTMQELLIPSGLDDEENSILERIGRDEVVAHFETVRRHKDGHLIDVSVTVSPIHDVDGRVVGAAKIARDITAEKKVRNQIIELNENLESQVAQRTADLQAALAVQRAIFEKAGYAIISGDSDRVIRIFNPAAEQLFGYRAEEVIGKMRVDQIHDPGEVNRALSRIPKVRGTRTLHLLERFAMIGSNGEAEWTGIAKGGRPVSVLSKFSVLRNARGQPSGFLAIVVDLSERKRREQELIEARNSAEEANRAKSEFLANMSHEIRTPMNAVLGMISLLQRSELNREQANYVKKASNAAKALLGIINDILDFSKIEANKLVLDPHPFDVEELLRDIAVILGVNVGDKDVELLLDISPDVPRQLVGDSVRLRQVLINLAGNAVKFTEKGEVIIRVESVSRTADAIGLAFEIQDSGIGMSEEQCKRVFKSFAQAEVGTARRFGGTGLGLTISQRLINAMGGELGLESELGKGSRFMFKLDFETVEGDTRCVVPELLRVELQNLRVLVVDDHDQARQVIAHIVQSLGWQPVQASTGSDALELIRQANARGEAFDVAIIDWLMPGMDGWSTAAEIRAQFAREKLPVVVMVTAHARRELLDAIDRKPDVLDGFLVKPVTPSDILDVVADSLAALNPPDAANALVRLPKRNLLKGLRVLLVDDNETNLEVARSLLAMEGAKLTDARSAIEAIDILSDRPEAFDAVLMDMQMPKIDGLEATRRIRRDLGLRKLPIIAMTANVGPADRKACLTAGMNAHVGKPFDIEQLVSVLLEYTGRPAVDLSALSESALATDLPAETGFDFPAALKRLADNRGLLASQAREFGRKNSGLLPSIRQQLADGDTDNAAGQLHGLRGIAGTLGARALAAAIEELEAQVKADPAEAAIDTLFDAAATQMARAIEILNELADRLEQQADEALAATATVEFPLELGPALAELQELLESQNMRAVTLFESLRDHLVQYDGDLAGQLGEAIGALNFSGALPVLSRLRRLIHAEPKRTVGEST